jgi:hypothetical protein
MFIQFYAILFDLLYDAKFKVVCDDDTLIISLIP